MPWISLTTAEQVAIARHECPRTHVTLRASYAPMPKRTTAQIRVPYRAKNFASCGFTHSQVAASVVFPSRSLSWHRNRLHHIMRHKWRVDLHHSLHLRRLWPGHHPLHLHPILLPQLHSPQPYLPHPRKCLLSQHPRLPELLSGSSTEKSSRGVNRDLGQLLQLVLLWRLIFLVISFSSCSHCWAA